MNDLVDNEIRRHLVKQQPCFAKLTDEEIEMLSQLLVETQVGKDMVLVTQGDRVDSVYFIVAGTADVRYVSIQDGKQVFKSLAKLKDGQTIGLSDTGFYSLSGIRTATVVAETDMKLFRLSVPAFNGFALANPHVNEVMRKNTAE